jgi:site-specific DNA-methyltransferase (adenine-specific)
MDKQIDLRLGDCLEVMKDIPDKSVDMVLCDLPYGLTQNKKDIALPFLSLWEQYERIIKDNGAIALFAQGLFFVDLVNSNRKLYRYDLVWDKVLTSGFLNAKRMPLRQHEQIAIFYKKLPTYNPQFRVGKPLHSKGVFYKTKVVKNQNYGYFQTTDDTRKGSTEKYPTSILTFPKPHPSVSNHATEKSVKVLEWLIKTYTNEGETVLDNCMGSGSTGVACVNTNRNFIGIELDEHYFEIAKERIYGTRIEAKAN